jgi:hypothetical protein
MHLKFVGLDRLASLAWRIKSSLLHGKIRNYVEKFEGVARASKLIRKGVYVGIVLDTASTAIEIRTACSTGREEECTKANYVEGGKLVGSVGVAAAAGTAAASTSTAVCVAVLGSATGSGALACMVVAAAVVG